MRKECIEPNFMPLRLKIFFKWGAIIPVKDNRNSKESFEKINDLFIRPKLL